MSAFVVSEGTIRLLVEAALKCDGLTWTARDGAHCRLESCDPTEPGYAHVSEQRLHPAKPYAYTERRYSPSALGRLLWSENVRSVAYRYEGHDHSEAEAEAVAYTHQYAPVGLELDSAQVVRSADCLDYQSCETRDWEETDAYRALQAIRNKAIHWLLEGRDDLVWGAPEEWEPTTPTCGCAVNAPEASPADFPCPCGAHCTEAH